METLLERDCTISHEGREFASGGAWLAKCSDGYWRGVVYAKPADPIQTPIRGQYAPSYPRRGIVTDWHGNKLADATFGATYRGNYCKMRSVRFALDGVTFTGRYCPDTADAVRVRSTKKV